MALPDLLVLVTTIIGSVVTVLVAILRIRDTVRDGLRELRASIGTEEPKTGLVGRLASMAEELDAARARIEETREWMLTSGYQDRRKDMDAAAKGRRAGR